MNDNQKINTEVLQLISNPTENAPTVSRFVEEHFSELVPHSDYFTHLVRDDVGGEMLVPQCLFGLSLLNDNCYPLHTTCSSPLKRGQYRTVLTSRITRQRTK